MTTKEELHASFQRCRPLFVALGDEARLEILSLLTENNLSRKGCGMNVSELTERTHLSRPAVSHHLKILKEAGIIGMRSEGTSNYYYLSSAGPTRQLMQLGFQLQEWIYD